MTIQLFINYKHGMVMTPFFHYGMYSSVMKPEATNEVFEIFVNGKQLQGKDFTPQQWDKIMLPLQFYSGINSENNALYDNHVKRLMAKFGIKTTDEHFVQQCDSSSFYKNYLPYLASILKEQPATVTVQKRTYHYNQSRLQPSDSIYSLSQLCR